MNTALSLKIRRYCRFSGLKYAFNYVILVDSVGLVDYAYRFDNVFWSILLNLSIWLILSTLSTLSISSIWLILSI